MATGSLSFTFRGLMAPVFTPFHHDTEKSLNLSEIPAYASFLKNHGVDGVLVNGTTGEGVSQTVEEREKTAEAWVTACRATGQTVMVQVGGTNLQDVRRLASHAEGLGVSSILCLADLFHRPKTADELLHYLKCVAEAAPKTPLLYYHIPAFTGIDVDVKEMLDKAEVVPSLVGLKFTSNDLAQGSACVSAASGKYAVFLGSDTLLAAALVLGFDSAIGTTLNMLAEQNLDIQKAVATNDVNRAADAQRILTHAIWAIAKHGSWVGTMKAAMNLMTPIKVGPARDPLLPPTQQQLLEIQTDLKSLRLLR